jgi:hypothetical protein
MTDEELIRRFEAQAIPRPEWTHRSHVKTAFLYLRALPYEQALQKIRTGIQKLNKANNVPEGGPDMGYNETTTVAFARLIAATISAYGTVFPVTTADEFCEKHPHLLSPHILRLFYSPQRRMDPAGKHGFVEPDLAPLPRIVTP